LQRNLSFALQRELDKVINFSMKEKHLARIYLMEAIREFFRERDFLDVLTPPAVQNPGMETHIHPYTLWKTREKKQDDLYLHTSPEFCMKELLSEGLNNIFTLSYVFRDEPKSQTHRPQFIMLEWYRKGATYQEIMKDCGELFNYCSNYLENKGIPTTGPTEIKKYTIQEIFKEFLNIDILNYLESKNLRILIKDKFPEVPLPEESLEWDDLFFLLFLNKIEPKLTGKSPWLLFEFPYQLAAYSTLKKEDPRVCERFEIYWEGLELCNCFNELTDPIEQKKRILNQGNLKKEIYGYSLSHPEKFLAVMDKGLPPSAGVALGVERLLSALTGIDSPFWD
jgi:lysyl-tRNA synthetase class 2